MKIADSISKWNGVKENWEIAMSDGVVTYAEEQQIIEAAKGLGGVSFQEHENADNLFYDLNKQCVLGQSRYVDVCSLTNTASNVRMELWCPVGPYLGDFVYQALFVW